MPIQIVMDHTGDTRHEFSADDQAGIDEAEKRFKELTGSGFIAAERTGPGKNKLVRQFNPTAEETLFFPHLKGG
jgi:hypothetical protein